MREKTPQRLSRFLSYREGAYYFSQKNTDEQNTQRPTETLSQPISQNLTAIFGSNVLWYLYAGGVLWVRNCAQICSVKSVRSVRDKIPHELNYAQKGSVKSVSSVREKTPQRISKTFFFSQRTQMSRTHRAHRERFALPRPLPFTPPCPAVQTSETLPRSPLPLHATSLPCREKSLHIIKLTTTRQAKIIIYNQAYNPQEIS